MNSSKASSGLLALLYVVTSGVDGHTPAPAKQSEFEQLALKSNTEIVWSKEAATLASGETTLILTAIEFKPASAPDERMVGIRIDISNAAAQDTVYVEDNLVRKTRALVQQLRNDIQRDGMIKQVASQCHGVYDFYTAEPLYYSLTAEYCIRPGFTGLRLTTLKDQGYELPALGPAALVEALDRALKELESRASPAL